MKLHIIGRCRKPPAARRPLRGSPASICAFCSSQLPTLSPARRSWSEMRATLLLVAAAALWRLPGSGSSVVSTTNTALLCDRGKNYMDVDATYNVWRSVSTRVVSSSFTGECVVNVTIALASVIRQPNRPPRLLLAKIEQLLLGSSPADPVFFVTMSHPTRRTNDYCSVPYCNSTYLWASDSVVLNLYIKKSTVTQSSYEASIVVVEATNVCDCASRSCELLVESREYTFAPDSRHEQLPPNNVKCTRDVEYSLTVRSSFESALLNVTVIACPWADSCAILLLNGRSCREGERTITQLPGSNITLSYRLRSHCNGDRFAGFIAIAEIGASARPSTIIVMASIISLAAASLAIGATAALLWCRRSRRRSLSRKTPTHDVHQARTSSSASDKDISMVQNEIYSVTLCSRTTAHQ